ncbi:MAG: hypothetical protein ACJ8AI_13725 [Rhodopila sp.]
MTALAQGAAGVALVMTLALLGVRQVSAAMLLLCLQSLAVATEALAQQQPVIAGLTILVNGAAAVWMLRWHLPGFYGSAPQLGSTTLGILAGATLATLSQSQRLIAEPLAVVLLSILLAATRRHSLLHLVALVSLQNGLSLVAAAANASRLAALPCFLVAAPLGVALASDQLWRRKPPAGKRLSDMVGWAQVVTTVVFLSASLFAPLDPVGTLFVPLLAAWGLTCAWASRIRRRPLADRVVDLFGLGAALFAVGTSSLVGGTFALSLAVAALIMPTARRRLDALVLASCGTGLALFGVLALSVDGSVVPVGSFLIGITAIGAVAPSLGPVCSVILLRLSLQGPWPPEAAAILAGLAFIGLTSCALGLLVLPPRQRIALLRLSLLLLVAVALSLDTSQGRFVAITLLILTILSDAAVRLSCAATGSGVAPVAAVAGLAGLPPVGTFTGIASLVRETAATTPWMLLPVVLALIAMTRVGLPPCLPSIGRLRPPSPAWVPLGLALAFGYAPPVGLVAWLRAITMSGP